MDIPSALFIYKLISEYDWVSRLCEILQFINMDGQYVSPWIPEFAKIRRSISSTPIRFFPLRIS